MVLVKAYEQSGLSQREFAKLKGERVHLISQWRSRFLKEGLLIEGELDKNLKNKEKIDINSNFLPIELKDERGLEEGSTPEAFLEVDKAIVLIYKNGFKIEYIAQSHKALMIKMLNLLLEVTKC